jgi:hypothetical protein
MFWSQMFKTAGRENRNPSLNHYENLSLTGLRSLKKALHLLTKKLQEPWTSRPGQCLWNKHCCCTDQLAGPIYPRFWRTVTVSETSLQLFDWMLQGSAQVYWSERCIWIMKENPFPCFHSEKLYVECWPSMWSGPINDWPEKPPHRSL